MSSTYILAYSQFKVETDNFHTPSGIIVDVYSFWNGARLPIFTPYCLAEAKKGTIVSLNCEFSVQHYMCHIKNHSLL